MLKPPSRHRWSLLIRTDIPSMEPSVALDLSSCPHSGILHFLSRIPGNPQLIHPQLHNPRIHPPAIPPRRHLLHLHPPNRLSLLPHPQHSSDPPSPLLSPRHRRLRYDLEKHLVQPRACPCGGLLDHWILWPGGQSDYQYRHGERGGGNEEEFHGRGDIRGVLSGKCTEHSSP